MVFVTVWVGMEYSLAGAFECFFQGRQESLIVRSVLMTSTVNEERRRAIDAGTDATGAVFFEALGDLRPLQCFFQLFIFQIQSMSPLDERFRTQRFLMFINE